MAKVNLEDSSVWRIVQDEVVSFGRLKGKFQLREAPGNNDEGRTLSHNAPGLVTTSRCALFAHSRFYARFHAYFGPYLSTEVT